MISFSIVTVTYNAEKVLQRTLDSVLKQTYKGVEHLIVDGASKDQTLTMVEQYKQQSEASDNGHRVIIQSEPDQGIYDAMNKGLRLATGNYVVFLNAGDTLYAADTLDIVARCASQHPLPAVVYGDTAITDDDGRFLHLRRHRPPSQLSWRSFRQGMLVCHQAFYVRADIARHTPYDLQYRHSADVDWCIRVMKAADRLRLPLVNSHAVLCNFAEGGDTTQHHGDSLCERFKVMASHYGYVPTLLLHGWFVVRAVYRRLSSSLT